MEAEIVETVEVVIDNTHIIGQATQITLIGILILFASLFVLWGIMEILVRVVKDPKEAELPESALETVASSAPVIVDEQSLKMQAAAAAVASIQNYDLKMRAAAAAAGFAVAKKK